MPASDSLQKRPSDSGRLVGKPEAINKRVFWEVGLPTGLGVECYIFRSHWATARGSNRTQVPTLKHGILPAAACLKIVTLDTERSCDRSSAVKAWPIFSI